MSTNWLVLMGYVKKKCLEDQTSPHEYGVPESRASAYLYTIRIVIPFDFDTFYKALT